MGQDSNQHPMVPVPEALRMVLTETTRILLEGGKPEPTETVSVSSLSSSTSSSSLMDLVGRVLAADVLMSKPGYPPYNASIMDGYAIRTQDEFPFSSNDGSDSGDDQDGAVATHRVVDKVYAGDNKEKTSTDANTVAAASLPPAYYITTGAVVPEGFNCVVPVEEVRDVMLPNTNNSSDKVIQIVAPPSAIQNQKWIRPIGCDIPPSSVVLPKGHVMDAVALGLLRQSKAATVEMKRRTRVGVLSTGNELIAVEEEDEHNSDADIVGKIPDVNRPILLSLLASYGNGQVEPIDLGMVRDDSVQDMAIRLKDAMKYCDAIITTGGVSMGETDIVEHVLTKQCGGMLHFGRMMMKPGKPTTFVTVPSPTDDGSTKIVFAMPGNPVSATVCTQLLVRPCLDLYFQGLDDQYDGKSSLHDIVDEVLVHPEVMATLAHDIKLDPKRPEYHRVVLKENSEEDGTYLVSSTGVQRSSRLMSLRDAHGLLVLPSAHGIKTVAFQGEKFPVLLLNYTSQPPFSRNKIQKVRMKDSLHMMKKGKELKVGVVEAVPENQKHLSMLEATCGQVQEALSGSKSGNAAVVWKKTFTGAPDQLYDFIANDLLADSVDFVVAICVTFEGSFPYHVDIMTALRERTTKVANSMALQARQGAAAQDPTAAIFELVVGYMPQNGGSMIVCLSDRGLNGALTNIRGLLTHGLNLARGKAHNHHHTHQNH